MDDYIYIYICVYILTDAHSKYFDSLNNIRGSLNKFPDFFRMGTFIDSTHMKLYSPSK